MNAWFGQLSPPNKLPFKNAYEDLKEHLQILLFKQADLCLNFNFGFFFFFKKISKIVSAWRPTIRFSVVRQCVCPSHAHMSEQEKQAHKCHVITTPFPLSPLPLGLTRSTLRLITLIIVSFGVISLIIRNQPRGSSKISPDWPTDGTVNFFLENSPFSLVVLTWH